MLAALAVLAVWPARMPVALGYDVGERQLKAEMIVRMLRLVTWPSPTTAVALPIRLTVVGDPSLADALRDASAGQRIDGRSLVVSHAVAVTQLADPPPAVVVLAAPQRASAPALAKVLDHKGVLTIGEGEGMGAAGLVLGVYVDGDRVRFDANTGAASRAGLSLSSHLLRLARIVG
ncbi:YfiR family protein [Luteitalea sp.]